MLLGAVIFGFIRRVKGLLISSDISINVENITKCYHVYDKPQDRLFQMLSFDRKIFYREFWALGKGVSFSINKGETVGIIGRNGSGKSTLLQVICGTLTPTSGSITTNGRIAALLELGAGFNPEFTGRENALLNAAIMGVSKEQIKKRMPEIIAFSELADFIDQPVKTYSSGMYARLAFSVAIHIKPDILIVDEALAVGDSRFVAKCMRKIKEIQALGAAILFVSHDITSVRSLCQRAIWIDKGCLIEDGDVFPVTGRYMEYMYSDDNNKNVGGKSEGETANSTNPNEEETVTLLGVEPVTHWGSNKGVIQSAGIYTQDGKKTDVIYWGQDIDVIIDIVVPEIVTREHLSVSFSIKDLKGSDIVVSTTHDSKHVIFPLEKDKFRVTFKLNNELNTGKYLLVAAVENRTHQDIHYYEYVEGVQYFSCLTENRFFVIYHPQVEQIVQVNE